MKERAPIILSLFLSVAALSYAAWVHGHTEAMIQQALRDRERQLVRTLAPKVREMYSGLGVTNIVGSPTTLEDLFGPYFETFNRMTTQSGETREKR
jgi:hypothetical protein